MEPHDLLIRATSGPDPVFDGTTREFLVNCREELRGRAAAGGLLECADLGGGVPWLWRLTFRTRGLAGAGPAALRPVERQVVALRLLPDFLRRADRFEMLALLDPPDLFHPNVRAPALCVQVRPGEPLLEICESLHALFSWRLRQLNERDALNPAACAWGRTHAERLPLDRRPLFGRSFGIELEPAAGRGGGPPGGAR